MRACSVRACSVRACSCARDVPGVATGSRWQECSHVASYVRSASMNRVTRDLGTVIRCFVCAQADSTPSTVHTDTVVAVVCD